MSEVINNPNSTPMDGPGAVIIKDPVPASAPMDAAGEDNFARALEMLTAKPAEAAVPMAEVAPASAPKLDSATVGEQPKDESKAAEPDPFAQKFELLQRKDAEIRKQAEAMKADLEELNKFRAAKRNAKVNLNSALEAFGLTVDDVTKLALQGGEVPEEVRIALEAKSETQKLREELAAREQQAQRQQQQAYIDSWRAEAEKFLTSSSEHEYTQQLGAEGVQAIMAEQEAYFKKHFDPTTGQGKSLDYKAAADIVEQRIEQHLIDRMTKTKKFASKYSAQAPSKPAAQSKTAPKTLTATMTATTQSAQSMTEEERMSAALKMLTQNAS